MERRLAAILAADVVGYSKLMGMDEAGTLSELSHLIKALIEPLIAKHNGRIVKFIGDGILAEFSSVVDAVTCAIAWQGMVTEKNSNLLFRIGINLGEIIIQDDDIFGNGVNVAARLEGLAHAGGICVSDDVYRQAKGKVESEFEDIGEQQLKNIDERVRTYRVMPVGGLSLPENTYRLPHKSTLPLRRSWLLPVIAGTVFLIAGVGVWLYTDYIGSNSNQLETSVQQDVEGNRNHTVVPSLTGPVLAVLPFTNSGLATDRDYFSEGITEEIISAMTRFSSIFVMSWNAVSQYSSRDSKFTEIANELDVDYLVTGSVQRNEDSFRISIQFIDAVTGRMLWSERYNGTAENLYDLQDRISKEIVASLSVKLSEQETSRSVRKPANELAVYDLVLRARKALRSRTRETNSTARELLEKAIETDPSYASAYTDMAWTLFEEYTNGWTEWPDALLEKALALLIKSIALDQNDARAHSMLSRVYQQLGKAQLAQQSVDHALSLNPNDPSVWAAQGFINFWGGNPGKAIAPLEFAMRFDPNIASVMNYLGVSYYLVGRIEDAILMLERGLKVQTETSGFANIFLVAAYSDAGKPDIALESAEQVRRYFPFFSVDEFINGPMFPTEMNRAKVGSALRRAGLD